MLNRTIAIHCIFTLFLLFNTASANDSLFNSLEDSILFYHKKINKYQEYSENAVYNKQIISFLEQSLSKKESFSYSFDSLAKIISIQKSPDDLFRIFTWNTLSNKGEYENFGFIQINNIKNDSYKLYQLTDKSDSLSNPEYKTLTVSNWLGAIYFNIIKYPEKNTNHYILLGWDGNNLFSSKKLIEVITIDAFSVSFGKPIFQCNNTLKNRVVFEYSSHTDMSLRYDEKKEMIIFDHLSPSNPLFSNRPEFYGPDFSYDGLYFENDKWNLVTDIDIRNPKPETKQVEKKNNK
ncbi:MAG: hypothetical protein IPO21_00825 [Bacteroidales bacterium]|nr:hypothetical protein [Bacteroidales bacterium]